MGASSKREGSRAARPGALCGSGAVETTCSHDEAGGGATAYSLPWARSAGQLKN